MKIKILAVFIFFILLFAPSASKAAGDVNVYFFWGDGCPHCAKEEKLLEYFENKYPYINVVDFEIYKNFENGSKFKQAATILNAPIDGVPFTVIGDKYFVGYSEDITANQLAQRIEFCHINDCSDSLIGKIYKPEGWDDQTVPNTNTSPAEVSIIELPTGTSSEINLPFLGTVDSRNVSLPIISVFMGLLDGFNPCAMWTLLFLISLLLGMKDKKRMWFLGSVFIVASAAVYFVFMAAWLNLILFIGFLIWVRLLIGAVALFGGMYNLREYTKDKGEGCKVVQSEGRQKTFERLKNIVKEHNLFLAFIGIILLAFAVNLVELVCSAGLPAIFTQILALNELSKWQYYIYILVYIFFFMIDDLIIFIIAMITLQVTGFSSKYSKYSKLIGGILMLLIGVLLIFKPEWLMFG